ncbi:MAG: hypothetical protein IKG67_06585 [Parasporobacterium sp.]|nr:hypothetical protein [Parasporobacterium sp.]
MLTVLFMINVIVGGIVLTRGISIMRKKDPNELTGTIKDHVSRIGEYTENVGKVETGFGVILLVLAGLMLGAGSPLALLIGDIILIIVMAAAFYLLKKKYMDS